MIRVAHQSQHPKQNLDRFTRFAGLTNVTNRQTDRRAILRVYNRPLSLA